MRIIKNVRVENRIFDVTTKARINTSELVSILIERSIKQKLLHMEYIHLVLPIYSEHGYYELKFTLTKIE